MKSFKKNIFLFFIAIVAIYFGGIKEVNATKLTVSYYTVQCIYSDGGLYTRAYSSYLTPDGTKKEKYTQNRINYNLKASDDSVSNQTSNFVFVNTVSHQPYDDYGYWKCKPYLYSAVYKYDNEEGETDENGTTYYKFTNSSTETISNEEFGTSKTGWQSFWGITSDSEEAANTARSNAKRYYLVSDSIIISENAPKPNTTLYYVQEATQASGTNKYLTIMIYDNVILVKSDSLTTALDKTTYTSFNSVTSSGDVISGAPETIYVNEPEPLKDTSGSKITYHYRSGRLRYAITTTKQNSAQPYTNQKYVLTDEIAVTTGTTANGEICDEMPETTLVLKDIIAYVQILLPIFLIVLTGVDIGRIMLAGNIDEELPKQRKKIVTRFIAAITIFFLPLVVNVLMDLMVDSSDPGTNSSTVKSIRCLFE